MKQNAVLVILFFVLLVMVPFSIYAQEENDIRRNQSFFVELGGSGVAILTANYDFRFNKGHKDGLGMRIGIGGESTDSEPFLGDGHTQIKMVTVPLEVNYILGRKNFSFEFGYSLTYISETKNSSFRLINPDYINKEDSGNFIVSYIPVGFRLKPKTNGFMLKFNLGPLINYSAPNVFYDDKVQFWAGLAVGYSFY